MLIKDIFASTVAFAVTVAPAFAQSATRAVAPQMERSDLAGGSSVLIIALVVALGIGIYFITKNDNNPDSP